MLTRFVRVQLVVFAIVSAVGMVAMAWTYMQVPTLLGIGRITVTLELPAGGGLYRFSNVTYRGAEIGKVTAVDVTPTGAKATLSLGSSPRIPADLTAEVRSVSAIGELYVDLLPRNSSPPYLHDGSVISKDDASIPKPVGPMLDKLSAFLGSLPKDELNALLDESSKGFGDAGYDLGSLLDSTSTLARDARGVAGQTQSLINDGAVLLDGAAASGDATRTWTRSLAAVTDQLVQNDPQIRKTLQDGPGAFDEVSQLLTQVKPTLPILLANLTSLGKVGVTYLPSLEQVLVLIPSFFADLQSIAPNSNATGLPLGNFRIGLSDPPGCTVGFLPQSQWRSPADTTTVDTPDGLYCKLPQDSPIAVRGLRNLPCMAHPGKRAPTVQICDSDVPFEPLAMRQHALGPSPIDPNLIAQGIAPDDRVPGEQPLYGPVEGTPLPPGAAPFGTPPPPDSAVPPAPSPPDAGPPQMEVPAGPPGQQAVGDQPVPGAVAPSSYHAGSVPGPSVAVATYDPRTGRFLTPGGRAITQTDLVTTGSPVKSWKGLILNGGAP